MGIFARQARLPTGNADMCLSIPAKVLEARGDRALVVSRGWTREVDTSQVSVRAGDFVLVQGGVAVATVDPTEAAEILEAWEEVDAADA